MTQFQYLDGGNTEAQDKLAEAYLFEQVSEGIAKTGVISGLAVSQTTTATADVKVGAGAAIVQASRLNGADRLVNDTEYTLNVLTANPVGGLPRNDIVVFDQATLPAGIRVIVGTPNASPTDPTVPATAVPLARLRHAASATTVPTSKIDDLRIPVRLFGPGVPFAQASGGGNVGSSVAVGALSGPFPQTFPAGRFTVAPNITMGTTDARCNLQATSISTTGFNLWVRNNSASTAPAGQYVYWTATQMTPTNATG